MTFNAKFKINKQETLKAKFTLQQQEALKAIFKIVISPTKVSQLENDLNFQTYEEVIAFIEEHNLSENAHQYLQELIASNKEELEEEISKKVETVNGSDFIDITREGATVIINSKTVVFEQAIATDTWTINYDLTKKKPTVDVIDSSGSVQVPNEIEYTTNTITLYFLAAFTGKAYLN